MNVYMCVCIYVHIYICIYVHIWIWAAQWRMLHGPRILCCNYGLICGCVCIYMYIHIYYICIYMYIYIHEFGRPNGELRVDPEYSFVPVDWFMDECICVCVCICTYMYIYICVYMNLGRPMEIGLWTPHTLVYQWIDLWMNIYMCVHTYTHIYIYIYVYMNLGRLMEGASCTPYSPLYRVAKTHRIPYLYRSFSAKEPYI